MNEKNNTLQPSHHPEGTYIGHSTNVTPASQSTSQLRAIQPADSFWKKVWNSLNESIGEIVFGMVDGTVSIFGLVFGLAPTASNSHEVLLAGAATGAAAAVSMMVGTYLDIESTQSEAEADIECERAEIQQKPQEEIEEIKKRLRNDSFNEMKIAQILIALECRLEAMLKFEKDTELKIGRAERQNPVVKSFQNKKEN